MDLFGYYPMNYFSSYNFNSNGKILLSGEYSVLYGSKAICLPIKFGQNLNIKHIENIPIDKLLISWYQKYQNKVFFYCTIELPDFKIYNTTNKTKSETLIRIFKNIFAIFENSIKTISKLTLKNYSNIFKKLIKQSKVNYGKIECISNLDFHPNWGLGSSSTLICNMSKWFDIDPYRLNDLIFNGSGFDIACCDQDLPFIYQNKNILIKKSLKYDFMNDLYVVYLNKKVSSLQQLKYLKKENFTKQSLKEINGINESLFIDNINYINFCDLIQMHENIISKIIDKPKVKDILFKNFDGTIKSLGAWGGDFILATHSDKTYMTNYFSKKGYPTIFKLKDLILN